MLKRLGEGGMGSVYLAQASEGRPRMALPAPVALDTRFRVTIVAVGSALRFVHNGHDLFEATRTTYACGRVVLGIAVPATARPAPRYEVAFSDIGIRTPRA